MRMRAHGAARQTSHLALSFLSPSLLSFSPLLLRFQRSRAIVLPIRRAEIDIFRVTDGRSRAALCPDAFMQLNARVTPIHFN